MTAKVAARQQQRELACLRGQYDAQMADVHEADWE
jgi:hypothetical protein